MSIARRRRYHLSWCRYLISIRGQMPANRWQHPPNHRGEDPMTRDSGADNLPRLLAVIEKRPLRDINAAAAAAVTRRIVGNAPLSPRLTITAFNSAV